MCRGFHLPLVGLLLSLMLAGCNRASSAPPRLPPAVVVAPVQTRDVPVEVRAPIDLRPLTQVDVGSKTLGYLDVVLVDRGDLVKRRQLLALVRPSDLPQQLAEARGSLAQTQASRLLARSNYERAKNLAPEGVVSQQELQQASSAVAATEAAEAAAKARIVALGVRIGETRIESPIDGVVTQRRLDPGALVGPGTGVIVTVMRVDVLRAFIAVNEGNAASIKLGQEAAIELDALPGKPYRGRVVRLAPTLDAATRTLDAEVHLENPEGVLRPGMYGRGAIRLAVHPRSLVLPISAVQLTDDQAYCYVVKGNKAERRRVTTGVDGEDFLEVTSGVSAGELVVTAGADGLAEGTVVRVVKQVDPFTGKPTGGERAERP